MERKDESRCEKEAEEDIPVEEWELELEHESGKLCHYNLKKGLSQTKTKKKRKTFINVKKKKLRCCHCIEC